LDIPARIFEQSTINELGLPYKLLYFEVVNDSEGTSINNVNVSMTALNPEVYDLDWLPVPLMIKHDRKPYRTSFPLNPKQHIPIDLVSGTDGDHSIWVWHILDDVNRKIPSRIPHRITVTATGDNVPPVSRIFEVWMEKNQALQCVLL